MGSNPPTPSGGREYTGWDPNMPGNDGSVPEILPPGGYVPPSHQPGPDQPGYGYAPPPPMPPPRKRSRWAVAPGTHTLLAINIAVFVLMTLAGINPITPSGKSLMAWGANNAGSVLLDGEWWRIVTATFVHGGVMHLGLNMWCLWNLGMLAEPLMGTFGVVAVYLLTGAAGNLLSTFFNWKDFAQYMVFPPGVGASGAVFGIAGALIVLLKSDRLPVPREELAKIRKSVIYFAGINLVIGFAINFGASRTGVAIDNWAHLGGCASGLLFAVPMVPRLGWPRRTFDFRLRLAIGMLVGVLVLFGFFLAQLAR